MKWVQTSSSCFLKFLRVWSKMNWELLNSSAWSMSPGGSWKPSRSPRPSLKCCRRKTWSGRATCPSWRSCSTGSVGSTSWLPTWAPAGRRWRESCRSRAGHRCQLTGKHGSSRMQQFSVCWLCCRHCCLVNTPAQLYLLHMNSCHYEFYILQFKCLIVVFTITSYSFFEGLSTLCCQATAVWNCRGLGFRWCRKCEVPAQTTITKEQAPGKCCMKSGLEVFAGSESSSSCKKEGRRKQSAFMKICFERIVMLINSCCVKEWILIFLHCILAFFALLIPFSLLTWLLNPVFLQNPSCSSFNLCLAFIRQMSL